MSTANVMAVANKRANELGINVLNSLITITQYLRDGTMLWRVNYGPKDYLNRRGGDLIIDALARELLAAYTLLAADKKTMLLYLAKALAEPGKNTGDQE